MVEKLDGLTLTIGALIAGCMTSVGLSAILGFQTFLYFQVFPADSLRYKFFVAWIWFTDIGHTVAVCVTIWQYAVRNFGNPDILSEIVLIITKRWDIMAANFKVNVVCGLAVSAATDIAISAARYYFLNNLKQGYSATQEMVDAVVVFTINDGLLSCATVIAIIACFLGMPANFIWIGIFFTLAKLFANSVLTTLNLRNWYRHRHRPMGIRLTRPQATRNTLQIGSQADKVQSSDMHMHDMPSSMQVFVDKEVEYNTTAMKYAEDNDDGHSPSLLIAHEASPSPDIDLDLDFYD
ncbi:hypothetical protein B0H13DRAFT_2347196 [Mycena leptocephala]|nr:hypothetical protein B0H13DRAFT_2347196 [Mycena leptocephala]